MADFDTLILGGQIIDGTGAPAAEGDLGIKDGRIAAIGSFPPSAAAERVDAQGMVVCPGFIDMHTHSDIAVLVDGSAHSKVRQGVTLDVIGESSTVAPLRGAAAEDYRADARHRFNYEVEWTDLTGYFRTLEQRGTCINIASGVSPQQVRRSVLGYETRPANDREVAQMQDLTATAMQQGAMGLTCAWHGGGPEHPAEVAAMARVAARYGGYYGVHLGSEGYEIDEELAKALYVGREAHISVHIYHLKVRGRKNFGRVRAIVQEIEAARAQGLDITANQYPYTAMQHAWARLFPRWVQDVPRREVIPHFAERDFRDRVKHDPEFVQYIDEHGGWDGIVASVLRNPALKVYEGKCATDIARMRDLEADPAEAVFDLVLEEGNFPHGVYHNMAEDDVRTVMKLPWVAIGSDGTALNDRADGLPHPRSFGTQRVLGKYSRDEGMLPLSEAIRKMTALPARVLGLKDRGALRIGAWADVVVFDPSVVVDRATFEQPKQYPSGVEYVFVNGQLVVAHREHTGARPGRAIYGPGRRS
ncbi:MAG: amidohydrolase family protein [Chloroflexi bacterium]|nr:amidohydrolase family protein [Chloroflexota bacterium]